MPSATSSARSALMSSLNATSAATMRWSGPRCMVRRSRTASMPGEYSISAQIARSSAGFAARPMRKSLLSRPSRMAITTSSPPMAIEAAPSQTGDPVTCRKTRPARGQGQADHRRAVLEQRGLDRGVRTGPHPIQQAGAGAPGFCAQLHEHPGQGGSLRETRYPEDHVGEERIVAAVVPEREKSLADREPGAGDKDPERREQRPEIPLLAIAERMPGVGRAFAPAQGCQQESLIEGVRRRVRGFGEHGAGANQDPGRELDRPDEDVRCASDEHRAARGGVSRHAAGLCPCQPGQTSRPPRGGRLRAPATCGSCRPGRVRASSSRRRPRRSASRRPGCASTPGPAPRR